LTNCKEDTAKFRSIAVIIGYANSDGKLLAVLLELVPTIKWLYEQEPVDKSEVPREHADEIRRLETLGLVYRRNARAVSIHKQRLKRLLVQCRLSEAERNKLCASEFAFLNTALIPQEVRN
jgi:hypothetical protein